MLKDNFFFWPYGGGIDAAIADLTPVFLKSALSKFVNLDDEGLGGNLIEFLALECRSWNVSPWWVVVSGQREQSTFGRSEMPLAAVKAWLGFVGQDVGRSPAAYYGVFMQIARMVQQSAWILGQHPDGAWPEFRTKNHDLRYRPGVPFQIEKDGKQVVYQCLSAAEWLQLRYTPHFKVLETNSLIAQKLVPARFL